jgi:serine/threonine protein kinase
MAYAGYLGTTRMAVPAYGGNAYGGGVAYAQAAGPAVQYAQAAPAQYLGAPAVQYAQAPAYQAAAPVQYAQAAPAQYLAAPAAQYGRAPAYQVAASPVQYAQAAPAQYLAAPQVAQAPVYQAAAQVQYAQPFQGFSAAAPASPYAAVNDKIVKLLGGAGTGNFRKAIKPFFDQASGGRGKLDYASAVRFFELASVPLLGVPMGRNNLSDVEFMRFDFDGDQTLSFEEAAKCLRHNIVEFQKEIGFKTEIPVPQKTPEQAGYTVVKVLASGGQGSTALATTRDGTKVALKIYEKANANAGGIEDLRGEMEVMKHLEACPNIMSCIEIFQDTGHYYCANELMPGGDLAALRDKMAGAGVAFTEAYCKGIFKQCVGALEYMHRNAMMHCDIKEPNVMVKNTDYSKPQIALIDFGLTKCSAGDGQSGGTPGYMPPEFFTYGVWLPRGDIFCMGVVFYQLLANKTPDEKKGTAGLFTENMPPMNSQDQMMQWLTQTMQTRQPDYRLIQGQFPGAMSFLPKMLEKDFRMRPKAPALMAMPWFK